jgi:hypothetical protein
MPREIIFRAWIGDGFLEECSIIPLAAGVKVSDQCTTEMWASLKPNFPDKSWSNEKPTKLAVLEQFTGLLDSKGVRVFENDVVEGTVEQPLEDVLVKGVVEYNGNQACWMVSFDNKGVIVPLSGIVDVEVRGNIHQHPELPTKQ